MSRLVLQGILLGSLVLAQLTTAQAQIPPASEALNITEELRYRVSLGRGDDIKLLLSKGADAKALSAEKVPLLCVAAARKDPEAVNAVNALLEGGADILVKDSNGQTALFYASRSGNKDMVEFLLRKGVDYYSLDNFGDIARTIAYRAERKDIVDAMDNYVKSQTLRINGMTESVQRLSEVEIKAASEANRAKSAEKRKADDKAKLEAEIKKIQQRRAAESRRVENLKKLETSVYALSYHACAFQYWSYAQAVKQTTEIGDKALIETIATHKKKIEDTSVEMLGIEGVDMKYVQSILDPSKQQIFDVLDTMPSRTARNQENIGKLDDEKKRCELIATQWDVKKK